MRRISIISIAILLSIALLTNMTTDQVYVAAPALVCICIVFWLWMALWNRDQKIPFFDVGMFCALATLIYTVYPLANYLIDGSQFGILSDSRLRSYAISPAELGFFHLRHVVYLFCFLLFYSHFRCKGTIGVGNVFVPRQGSRNAILFIFLLLTGYFILLSILTGYNANSSYETETYASNLSIRTSLPLFLLQISAKLQGIQFVFKVALLFIVINRCNSKRWFRILLLWILAEIVITIFIKGSRTGLVLFLMAAALLYHRIIGVLSTKFLFISGVSLLLGFIFFGLYRTHIDLSSLQSDLSRADAGIFVGGNEFQALLGTAYDVFQRKDAGAYLPWYLYFNDIIALFPPQQLLPFEKVTAAEWYLREIGMSGTGVGFMWGVISQSIVGLDWLELAFRGAILGYILARFHNWYVKHQSSFLATLLYVFFCVKIYYTFRDTTFSFLTNFIWEWIPFYILFYRSKPKKIFFIPQRTHIESTQHG